MVPVKEHTLDKGSTFILLLCDGKCQGLFYGACQGTHPWQGFYFYFTSMRWQMSRLTARFIHRLSPPKFCIAKL